jgi:hypothetical protein
MNYLRFESNMRYARPVILLALASFIGLPGRARAANPQSGEPSTANWAVQLDGADDYVDLNPSPLGELASLTVEAWVRIDEAAKLHYLVTDAYDDYNDGFSLVVGADGRVSFVVAASLASKGIAISSRGLTVGEWHHVAGVYDGANNAVRVYVDGVEEAAVAYTGGIRYSGARDLLFGSQKKGYSRSSRYLKGALDEVRIWGTARTADDIAAEMRAEIDEGSSDLLGYWRFNEGSGLSAEDMTSAGNTARLIRGPLWIEADWQVVAPLQVAIDIRPFARRNVVAVNPGKIPVALLSAEDLNAASDVDRRSLTFGRTGSEPSLDLRWHNRPNCRVWDVNRDHRSDLVCWFVARATEFEAGDSRGVLKGVTTSGTAIVGSDAIIVRGRRRIH